VEWDAWLTEDRPGELIAWQSVPGSDVQHSGRVRFRPAPGGRGTEVEVELSYRPPAGGVGRMLASALGREPRQLVADDLRRFKAMVEAGEPIVSEATVNGSGMPQRPAQPPPDDAERPTGTLAGAAR
jgi:uncharacterized membrane protein